MLIRLSVCPVRIDWSMWGLGKVISKFHCLLVTDFANRGCVVVAMGSIEEHFCEVDVQ